ncbi:hypothetical protein HAV15_011009 [Penicillium sp. str. |nr:hypothetical protein HAV15_011009 [Penicillium sp. str. \
MSSDTVHFWPGGVPADLPVYQGQEQWFHEVEEEIKGWLLFVKENWTTSQAAGTGEGGIEYAPSQRRKLMLQWASYSQSVREEYHNRALPQEITDLWYSGDVTHQLKCCPNGAILCLSSVGTDNPANRARWIKLLILMNRFDLAWENPFAMHESDHQIFCAESISPNLPDIASASRWLYLENPAFGFVHMTRSGEVVFDIGDLFVIDQHDLQNGFVSLVKYGVNGEPVHQLKVRPWNMPAVMRELGMRCTIDGQIDSLRSMQFLASKVEIDMDAPILEILQKEKDARPNSPIHKSRSCPRC